jgi:hypothetical protein
MCRRRLPTKRTATLASISPSVSEPESHPSWRTQPPGSNRPLCVTRNKNLRAESFVASASPHPGNTSSGRAFSPPWLEANCANHPSQTPRKATPPAVFPAAHHAPRGRRLPLSRRPPNGWRPGTMSAPGCRWRPGRCCRRTLRLHSGWNHRFGRRACDPCTGGCP